MTAGQVVQTISKFIDEDPKREYKIIVGTDSEKRNGDLADFVTAIVVHRVGNGGRYFWRHAEAAKIHTLRDRMTHEVIMSLEIAKDFLQLLQKCSDEFSAQGGPALSWDFEIHVDIGENGATKVMIQELVGMIRANNFEVKTKPDSYAASKVADRHV